MSEQHTKIKYRIRAVIFKALFFILTRLSLQANQRIGAFIGWLATILPNRNHHITKINIQRCFPELDSSQQDELIQKSLIETGKTSTEVAPMWLWDKQKALKTIQTINGEEILREAYESKQGVILAFPHLGNWELVSLYCASKYPLTTLYQPLKLMQFDRMIRKARERTGAKLVATDNAGIRALLNALKAGEMIGVLPDQEPKFGNGEFSPFFNIPAYTGTLVSRMTNKTNAKVVFAFAKRLNNSRGFELNFLAAPDNIYSKEISESLAALNKGIENCIQDIPEQYQWSYYRFRTRPKGEKPFYK